MLLTKEKAADKIRRSKSNECWASPKVFSLSAESDQRLCLWNLRAFSKARAKLLSFLEKSISF